MGVPSPVSLRGALARRGNSYSPAIAREQRDRGNPHLLRCDASRGSQSRRRTDYHGPHGPRNDRESFPPLCHCEEGFARRGNPYSPVIAREQRDRGNPHLLQCDASRGSQSRRRTDSHGPHGPRKDMAASTLPHSSYRSINGKLGVCLRSRPIVF